MLISNARQEPWERLEEILQADDPQQLRAYLGALLPGEAARALARLRQEAHLRVFTLLTPKEAADLLEELSETQAAALLKDSCPRRCHSR